MNRSFWASSRMNRRSCSGNPSIRAITRTGSGVAKSCMTSICPFASASSSRSLIAARTIGRQASMALGVK